jgi:hypothetical protein
MSMSYLVVSYDVNDRVVDQSAVACIDIGTAADRATQAARKLRSSAQVQWHRVSPQRMDGRVLDAGRYLGGVLVLRSDLVGGRDAGSLIQSS